MTGSRPPCILVTRPAERSASLCGALQDRGFDVLPAPVLTFEPVAFSMPDPAVWQVIVFTSVNGVTHFSQKTGYFRDVQVYAVGPATAAAARSYGYQSIEICPEGNAAGLVRQIMAGHEQGRAAILHVCGRDRAFPLAETLQAQGYKAVSLPVYEANSTGGLDAGALAAIRAGHIDAVMFFSARTAGVFMASLREENALSHLKRIKALCLGPGMLECVQPGLWDEVCCASVSDTAAMIRLAGDIFARHLAGR